MDLANRKEHLLALAAKRGRTKEFLYGKLKRKDIEKTLAQTKKLYTGTKSSLVLAQKRVDAIRNELAKAEAQVDEITNQLKIERGQMLKAHSLLQEMDLHGAEGVRVKNKGEEREVLFAVDGRWVKPEAGPEAEPELDLDDPEVNPEGYDFSK